MLEISNICMSEDVLKYKDPYRIDDSLVAE